MNTISQHFDELADLLQVTGSRPPRSGRGKWDCGRCGGKACLSVDLGRGLFHCFHGGCDFSGNAEKLARELGFAKRLTLAEYRERRQNRESAVDAARLLYEQVQNRRLELLEELCALTRLEVLAHEAGMNHRATWGALALVCAERPKLLAELLLLENAPAGQLVDFLGGDLETRMRAVTAVIERGGVPGRGTEWVELLDC